MISFDDAITFYQSIKSLCKPNEYNLILHKHLGDNFYIIGTKDEFENRYNSRLNFIVRSQHEFLMEMYGIKNYKVYDLDSLVKKNVDFQAGYFGNIEPNKQMLDSLENKMFQSLFHCVPIKGEPFVCETIINNFFSYPYFWAYRWGANMGIKEDFYFSIPNLKPKLSDKARDCLKEIAPLDKIVLIAPEAATAIEFPCEFWNIIAEKVHQHGYKIIVNSKKYEINHGISTFDLDLSLKDIVALGLSCAYVFSLRSGLCDVLVGAMERLYAFYPAMLHREINSFDKCFNPKPNVHEIAINQWKIDNVIWEDENITNDLQKHINLLHRSYWYEKLKMYANIFSKKKYYDHKWSMLSFRNIAGNSKMFPENNILNKTIKHSNDIRVCFLGIPLFSRRFSSSGKNIWNIKRKYLGGIVTFKNDDRHRWKLLFCGIQIYSHSNKRDKFLFLTIHKRNFQEKWIKKLDKKIDEKYDDIYILRHNIGETYVELMHLVDRIKTNQSKNPLVIVWDERYFNFYKMFIPDDIGLKYIALNQADIHDVFCGTANEYKNIVLNYGNRRYFCSTPKIAQNIKKESQTDPEINFYSYINNCINMPKNSVPIKPYVSPVTIRKADCLAKQIELSDKFVIFAPEANSLKTLNDDFWNNLAEQFHQKGYDIYVNSHLRDSKIKYTKTSNTTIDTLFVLAQKSKGIITLGSGLSVFLTAAGVPMDIIYTDFNSKSIGYDAASVIRFYSVLHLPNTSPDLIKEYNANKLTALELGNEILKRY